MALGALRQIERVSKAPSNLMGSRATNRSTETTEGKPHSHEMDTTFLVDHLDASLRLDYKIAEIQCNPDLYARMSHLWTPRALSESIQKLVNKRQKEYDEAVQLAKVHEAPSEFYVLLDKTSTACYQAGLDKGRIIDLEGEDPAEIMEALFEIESRVSVMIRDLVVETHSLLGGSRDIFEVQ